MKAHKIHHADSQPPPPTPTPTTSNMDERKRNAARLIARKVKEKLESQVLALQAQVNTLQQHMNTLQQQINALKASMDDGLVDKIIAWMSMKEEDTSNDDTSLLDSILNGPNSTTPRFQRVTRS